MLVASKAFRNGSRVRDSFAIRLAPYHISYSVVLSKSGRTSREIEWSAWPSEIA